MVKDGRIDMKVGFKEVGIPDPNPNKVKDLDVSYTLNGAPSSGKFKDGQRFKLDAPPKEGGPRGSVKDHVSGVFGLLISNAFSFIGWFLFFLNLYTAYYLGPQLFGNWLTAIIGLIPMSMFWLVPFFLFFVRLFYSSDIIIESKFASSVGQVSPVSNAMPKTV
jgi:hypothetical protein